MNFWELTVKISPMQCTGMLHENDFAYRKWVGGDTDTTNIIKAGQWVGRARTEPSVISGGGGVGERAGTEADDTLRWVERAVRHRSRG